MNVDIRKYDDHEHRDQVTDIWRSVFHHEDPRNDPSLTIDKKLEMNDDLFFVALRNETVVGTIMAGYDGHRGWIYTLAVIPERRKLKIGSKLLEYAEKELKKLGCVKINLQVNKTDEIVTEFYLKNGFSIEDRISMGKEIPENIE